MLLGLPLPLALALTLSYIAMALVVAAAISIRRETLPRVQALLWGGLTLGAFSIAMRTAYYAIA